MSGLVNLAFVSCGAVLALGCSTEPVQFLTWPSLTEEEVALRLNSPTADLPQVLDDELLAGVQTRLPALIEMTRFLGSVAGVVVRIAETDYSEQEAALPELETPGPSTTDQSRGSSFYLRLACPGPEPFSAPVTDFSAGETRLDSPKLTSLDLESLMAGGEFLLSFQRCQIGPLELDVSLPGRYMTDEGQLNLNGNASDPPASALALSADEVDDQAGPFPLGLIVVGCGGQRSCDQDLRLAAELKTAEGTIVLTLRILRSYWSDPEQLSLSIASAGVTRTCDFSHGPGYSNPSLTCRSE